MKSKNLTVAVFIAIALIFSFGVAVEKASADAIMFPWIVKSPSVITLLSVVNTSDLSSSCNNQEAKLHYEYYLKDASVAGANTTTCGVSSFQAQTSKNDIVSFDASGTVGTGALFNDQPPHNGNVTYAPNSFSMPTSPAIARAFLLVDNNNENDDGDNCFDDAEDASLYGEALVIQLDQGAAWGYVAYNAAFGGPHFPSAVSFNDPLDMQGEAIRSPRYFDDASDWEELETTPTILLPLGTNQSLFKTKFFVTPVNYALYEYDSGPGQRTGAANSRIELCLDPQPASGIFPITSPCPSGLSGISVDGESCQTNGDPVCRHSGIYDNDEGILDGNSPVDVVCTTALDISDTSTGLLTQGQVDFLSTNPGGQMWTYVRSMVGSFWPASGLGIRDARTESDSLIGKLAYQDSLTGFTINSTTIHGAVNDFQWIRNSASQDDGAWDLTHGINVVGRGF